MSSSGLSMDIHTTKNKEHTRKQIPTTHTAHTTHTYYVHTLYTHTIHTHTKHTLYMHFTHLPHTHHTHTLYTHYFHTIHTHANTCYMYTLYTHTLRIYIHSIHTHYTYMYTTHTLFSENLAKLFMDRLLQRVHSWKQSGACGREACIFVLGRLKRTFPWQYYYKRISLGCLQVNVWTSF